MMGLLIPLRRSVKIELDRREGGRDETMGPDDDRLG
jgi:hypothetical protein